MFSSGVTAEDMRKAAIEMVKWMNDISTGEEELKVHGAVGCTSGSDCPLVNLYYDMDIRYLTKGTLLGLNGTHSANMTSNLRSPKVKGVLSGGLPPLKPTNLTLNDVLPTYQEPPRNGEPLCKRYDDSGMTPCKGADTLLSSEMLGPGSSLYSQRGARLYVEKNGNLCLYYYTPEPKNYWCWNHGIDMTGKKFTILLTYYGSICLFDMDNIKTSYCTPGGVGDFRYRMTLQNDGNLVVAHVVNEVIWASNSNIFPYNGPTPCTHAK